MISIPEPYVTVITLDGEQQSVLASALYDPKTSQPAVRSVLVIDRQSNQQVFIDLDQLPAQSQMDARYILLTDQPGTSDSPAGTRL